MQTLQNISKEILAAFIYFTRLPFYKITNVPKWYYSTVVEHWPLVGWLTGGLMATVLYFGSWIFPYPIAVLLAIGCRLLVTGAFHEDGLADFFDGFGGGGNDRQRILDIMKDSRIGTYGVLGLIIYSLVLFTTLYYIPPKLAALCIFAGDPFCKMIAAQIIVQMPYARTEDTAKSKVVYRRFPLLSGISLAIQGLLPMVPLFYFYHIILRPEIIILIPCLMMFYLSSLMRRKIQGYTGDCCGAMFLLCELSYYLTILYMYHASLPY
jgi:adenosylcobinamide-GDP ribazoletransferase